MAEPLSFDECFHGLTERQPFGWQKRLYAEFLGNCVPPVVDIPTGLGKTAVIQIWLIALAEQARSGAVRLPRRLVYVVDRRTVVDQATDVAMDIRKRLGDDESEALKAVRGGLHELSGDQKKLIAISTLRGEFADNREWQEDPARAAIIVGTVDMIGSRLLFSGYGVSRKMRPFHAGLLGQDTLIVHDEAHLSPAFGKLIKGIEAIQKAANEPRSIRVMELSATQRAEEGGGKVFGLREEEKQEEPVRQRLTARKSFSLTTVKDRKNPAPELAERALAHENERARVVVYVRSPDRAQEIAEHIRKRVGKDRVATLTGTIRGHERDELVKSDLFARFKAKPDREPPPETIYLVATSAGEVGIDLDADHMVSDLTTLDSMIQRLGRVNRLGEGAAVVDVVEVPPDREKGAEAEDADDHEKRIAATKDALLSLPIVEGTEARDANPALLGDLVKRLVGEKIDDETTQLDRCFSKTPTMVGLTDILLDGWAMTSIEDLPGRPPVERWLRGITSEPPSVYLAWREEADAIVEADDAKALKTLFDKHPILAAERLRASLRKGTIAELTKIAKRLDQRKVVLLPARGSPEVASLTELVRRENWDRLRGATIVLPLAAGGLDGQGMLDGEKKDRVADVADVRPAGEGEDEGPRRLRVLFERDADSGEWSARVLGGATRIPTEETSFRPAIREARNDPLFGRMAETARIVLERDDEGVEKRALLLFARRGTLEAAEDSQDAPRRGVPVELDRHNEEVRQEAARIAAKLGVPKVVEEALILAATRHDLGKDRAGWQKAIGHAPPRGDPGEWKAWAKSDQKGFDDEACGKYRHEFGSLRQASQDAAIADPPERRDLILHLIAAHHGWARPHFREEHGDIADTAYGENETIAAETMRRFARLQRRFGRWGLAWLESLVRSADYRVSSGVAPTDDDEDTP